MNVRATLSIRVPVIPRPPVRRRTERERLLAALDVCPRERWPLVWQHMAEKLWEHDCGRLKELF